MGVFQIAPPDLEKLAHSARLPASAGWIINFFGA